MKNYYKVGSRDSALAKIQTKCIIQQLEEIHPDLKFDIVTMKTIGDQIIDKPLPKIGEKSLFTKELEVALLEDKVDFVVHSLKDMPTTLPDGLAIGAITEREDPRDALILKSKHKGLTLSTLPKDSIIGTSSLRRTAQLKKNYPSLRVESIRGNLQTRLRKLDSNIETGIDKNHPDYDGIVLAMAGILRMGWDDRISQILEDDEMLYAVGQGALAVECKTNLCPFLSKLSDELTVYRVVSERSLLASLEAGCTAPLAVTSKLLISKNKNCTNGYENKRIRINNEQLILKAAVWSLDGSEELNGEMETALVDNHESNGNNNNIETSTLDKLYCGIASYGVIPQKIKMAYDLGKNLAKYLLGKGAHNILQRAKQDLENTN